MIASGQVCPGMFDLALRACTRPVDRQLASNALLLSMTIYIA